MELSATRALRFNEACKTVFQAMRGFEEYDIVSADEIENSTYLSSYNQTEYTHLIAKQIYLILQIKSNTAFYDEEQVNLVMKYRLKDR